MVTAWTCNWPGCGDRVTEDRQIEHDVQYHGMEWK
jgi:hypothetical protein